MSGCCCNMAEKSSVEILSVLLANTYVLYVKTQNVHWNVTGGSFGYIHELTEKHYNDMFIAIDEIAERIRMIGDYPPSKMSDFLKLSCISENLESKTDKDMLQELRKDHECMVEAIKQAIGIISNSNDFGTIDILSSRLNFHEKAVWMMKSNSAN